MKKLYNIKVMKILKEFSTLYTRRYNLLCIKVMIGILYATPLNITVYSTGKCYSDLTIV
jgi:hypothetical protein